MKRNDIIFAIICGLSVAWVGNDFLPKYGWLFFIILPILSVCGLLLCDIIGKKLLFVHQAGKFALAGAFADVVDIKVYQFLFLLLPFPLFLKAFSFFIATIIKYLTNKHWSFEKHEGGEVVQFFVVAIVGLLINVVSFYCATEIIHPQFGISAVLWTESSIIFAALVAAAWNFLGYKFIVFKK
jgi:putative flippase GtrA